MEFVFHMSAYDADLETETAKLFQQRVEAHSRQAVPKLWKLVDKLNSRKVSPDVQALRRKRYRIYGVVLMALGVVVLVPGLTAPRTPGLIAAGTIGILAGILEFHLSKEKKPPAPPLYCRQAAEDFLADRRRMDWKDAKARFSEAGAELSIGDSRETVPYGEMTSIFETERLWMLLYEGEKALLLQKKDLVSGEAEAFLPYLQGKIIK